VILKVVLAIVVVLAVIVVVGMFAVRGLRTFVRSVWPHS
jgi:hypothetical protein